MSVFGYCPLKPLQRIVSFAGGRKFLWVSADSLLRHGLMVEFVIRVNQQRTAFTLEQETSREFDYGNCSEHIFGLLVQPLRVEALVRLKRFNSNCKETFPSVLRQIKLVVFVGASKRMKVKHVHTCI